MKARRIVALVLFIVALPVVFVGLIDPLEGGIALLLGVAIYAVGFVLARNKPARYLWIPYLAAILIGSATLGSAIWNLEFSAEPSPLPPLVLVGLWVYRVAVVAALVGGVITVWNAATALKSVPAST